jgi:protein-S-isoprenylcysteine O-methyltransferase Ste14
MKTKDYAQVAIKPPLLFAGALGLGYLLTRYVRIGRRAFEPSMLGLAVGLAFIAAGLVLADLAIRRFRLAGTSVAPGKPATKLVTDGPYRVTRNPIYVGFVLIYFGVALVMTSLWLLLLLVPVLVILQNYVVLREEAYLEQKFGDEYRKYASRVPRWL